MRTDELNYRLPSELIATSPAEPRDSARLMVIDRQTRQVEHHRVSDLPDLPGALLSGDLMIFNRSRVLPANFTATRTTGGKVDGLYLSSDSNGCWRVLLESRGKLREGEMLRLDENAQLELLQRIDEGGWLGRYHGELAAIDMLQRIGLPPLPPYIRRQRKNCSLPEHESSDIQRYNTVYASDPGSVAAPTAGLHFTGELMKRLADMGISTAFVTLHVGVGTFAPVRCEQLADHVMHHEWMSVPPETVAAVHEARGRSGRIICVGTTTVRAMESLPQSLPQRIAEPLSMSTNLFIRPAAPGHEAFEFRFTDVLMTNFHLPQSTLLAMVAALPNVGMDQLKQWYELAIKHKYRFYSYGDAMLLL